MIVKEDIVHHSSPHIGHLECMLKLLLLPLLVRGGTCGLDECPAHADSRGKDLLGLFCLWHCHILAPDSFRLGSLFQIIAFN